LAEVKNMVEPHKKLKMRPGRIAEWRMLSSTLAIFRLVAKYGGRFPPFIAGQYIALRRDDCLLTKSVTEGNEVRYVPDLDADGKQKLGPVTHLYPIASAPFEAAEGNYLEFYVVLEREGHGDLGRFTESLFLMERSGSDALAYLEHIAGNFTLARRAAGFEHVLMVATGTGLAPFVSMVKQLYFDAQRQGANHKRYTLLHANRTYEELAYHRELIAIEASNAFDFVYVPSVSRPTAHDRDDVHLGAGRANNLLRQVFIIPARESQAVLPELPRDRPLSMLQKRIDPSHTVVLACGNPDGMADIAWISERTGMRFEKEEW
jgi:ferredoxin-NADP reductase